ncbi:MAG TPA: T9SS type A sorting domain-containing protein [Candidatus Eisenbacteria bacterium]
MARRNASHARAALASSALLAAALCARGAFASDCTRTSVGFVPLIDLGTGTYHGFTGGLYPGGANSRPPAHDSAGLAIAAAIEPLDTLGNPDPVNGRIVLISIGMSNATQEFSAFVPKAMGDPGRHPRLLVIDCAKGGQATQDIRRPDAAYWDTVATRLRGHGSSPLQAQAAWIKEARRGPTEPFPASAESLTNDLGTIVRILHGKLPNLRLAYLTSRIYAGYATSTLNPEPYAYESGFAVRWLIEAQIAGVDSLEFDPERGPVRSPWLSWGPYLWADGLTPRSDGLIWRCEDFQSDGTHPSASGRDLVADSLLAFFKGDATTTPWFVSPGTVSVEARGIRSEPRLSIAPNPARPGVEIAFATATGPWRLEILDLGGRRVRALARGAGEGVRVTRRWDGRDDSGVVARAGLYWVRLISGDGSRASRVVWLGGD